MQFYGLSAHARFHGIQFHILIPHRGTTLPLQVKFTAIVCCTAFGGFSTVAQTSCMLNGTGLSIFTYLKGKLVNAAVAAEKLIFW